MNERVRLNKFISEAGICSRRNADILIVEGRVEVNGETVSKLGYLVDPEKDIIKVDGEKIKKTELVYYLFNKPSGLITTLKDEKNRPTIFDVFKVKERVFPIGRLDYDTTGALLLTNDGDFAHLMLHPKNKIKREYVVKIDKNADVKKLESVKRLILEDGPIKIEHIKVDEKDSKKVWITLTEGRNRIVKRIFSKLGYKVQKLHRVSYERFNVDNLPIGRWKKIHFSTIQTIKNQYAKN